MNIMTVKELIKELQKMPQNATVYYQDFDAAEFEISSSPSYVWVVDFDKATEYENKIQNDFNMKGKIVFIHA
jgi:hypothetical protein